MKKQTIIDNLKRIWKALRRELGDNDLLRDDFKQTINYEFVKNGFGDAANDDKYFNEILNCK